ncbi:MULTISPECIES: hypothetical protein [Streptomycetaceae]|uniref:Integral membrane protein n=1 Tax=Streptantibioticus cattleyicolor (strain ATCC 35852 / DSM 46488 / JCM 4925 / NBRC 14057 / NRRL 8057) TaxID=1003195 RepID=G8WWM3_STREN|nr:MULTISPECIES: hypothetical protein [Streptomycetaceae]AEW94910.1 integral membrane protein [Streptantibioticus cattleyicolor NRRL 8057 = DSM 46488]
MTTPQWNDPQPWPPADGSHPGDGYAAPQPPPAPRHAGPGYGDGQPASGGDGGQPRHGYPSGAPVDHQPPPSAPRHAGGQAAPGHNGAQPAHGRHAAQPPPAPGYGGTHAGHQVSAPLPPAQPYQHPYAGHPGHPPAPAPPAVPWPEPAPATGDAPVPESAAGTTAAPAATVRTGSPIIPPGIQPALLTVVLAALTAGGAWLGRPALAVAAVLLQAVTAAGWFRLNGMWPARQGIALAFLAGVAADAGLLAAPTGQAPAVILGTLGVWILLILVQQMRHRGDGDERLASLTATAASTVLAVLASGHLAAAGTSAGYRPVVVAGCAVAVATVVRAVRLPAVISVVLALAAAAGSGYGCAHLMGLGTHAVLFAAAAGVCAVIGLHVASYDWPSRFVHFTAGVALPLAAAAPVVYLLGHFAVSG